MDKQDARRERVYALHLRGGTREAIGAALGVSERTVGRDLQQCRETLGSASHNPAVLRDLRARAVEALDRQLALFEPRSAEDRASAALWLRLATERHKLLSLYAPPAVDETPEEDNSVTIHFVGGRETGYPTADTDTDAEQDKPGQPAQ